MPEENTRAPSRAAHIRPTSFEINGRQFVAVLSGWGVDAEREQARLTELGKTTLKVPQGGVLWVFGLE